MVTTALETESARGVPRVELRSLDTLWFQVAGTLCNLACSHCFISCSPTNRTHVHMSLDEVVGHLDDARALGVKEYYFTGGEPFLNPEMEAILARTLEQGPATVLTNGLLLDGARCARLRAATEAALEELGLMGAERAGDADAPGVIVRSGAEGAPEEAIEDDVRALAALHAAALSAPRESASSPKAPAPANRSRTRAPSIGG